MVLSERLRLALEEQRQRRRGVCVREIPNVGLGKERAVWNARLDWPLLLGCLRVCTACSRVGRPEDFAPFCMIQHNLLLPPVGPSQIWVYHVLNRAGRNRGVCGWWGAVRPRGRLPNGRPHSLRRCGVRRFLVTLPVCGVLLPQSEWLCRK